MALCFSPLSQAATAAGEALFDHTKTGFILKDVHTTLRCEQCHLDGIFKNTPKDCAGCHSTGSRIGASPKPINHVQTTETCDTCHSSASSFQVKSFTHAGIASGEAGNCESCHNGQSQGVTSKPSNHFPTLQPCGLCHTNTVEFKSWTMDHKGLVSNCVSCHGATAELYPDVVFKPVAHVPTTAACETCHPSTKFDNFTGASFIHITSGANSVKNNCKSCHTGQYKGVTVKHAGHIYDTNVQCDVCHTSANTNGYTSFLGAKYNHISATTPPALGNCFRCHDTASVTATKKAVTHIPTTAACDSCHTRANTSNYSTFKGGSYTHANPAGVCSTCHNGATAKGVAAAVPAHVATTAACDTCHANAVTSGYKSFLGASYIHASPAGVCSSCHTGTPGTAFGSRLALGKSANHVATTAACDTCHTQTNTSNYTTFTGGIYVHSNPPGVCSSCHKPGGPGLDKSVYHVNIGTAACDKCHTQSNTSNFTTFYGATFIHPSPMLDRCDTCHVDTGNPILPSPTLKSANHVPTTVDCVVCHTPATLADYTTFTGAIYLHPTPVGSCITCHDGTIAPTKSAVHVPIGSTTCQTCHDSGTTNNYTTFFGAKIHTPANPTPGVCSTCHDGNFATGKSATHVSTGAACDTCHTPANTNDFKTFFGAAYVHVAPIAVCSTCHNGSTALGKPANHVVTTATCDVCHTPTNTSNFTTFLGGNYPHPTTGLAACSSCHNGTTATGKTTYHIEPSGECNICHTESNTNTYKTFFGGIYTHVLPLAACSSCHNGTSARGMSVATHIPTNNAACETCHKNAVTPTDFTSFSTKVTFVHGAAPGVCSTCHTGINGIRAKGMSAALPSHVPTTAACDTCHANAKVTYTNWLGASYIHAIPAGTCSSCHTGTTTFGSKAPLGKSALHVPTSAACDTCHANAKSSYTNWLGATYVHQSPMIDSCSTCHRSGGYALAKSATHVPTSAACDICHTPATISNYTTFLGAAFVHISPVGACANCHNGVTALGKSALHVPTTATCESCHNATNFTSFLGITYVHPNPPGVCSTCHDGNFATGKSSAHVTTLATCDTCHNTSHASNGYASFFGATYVHATPPGVCATCHNGTTATGMSGTHVPINGAACDTCHNATNTNGYRTFFGATYVHASPAGVCSTCHNGTTALGKTASHVVTTAACDVCHTPTNTTNFTTFLGGNYPHPTTGVAGICSTCHDGNTATGKTTYHVSTSAECDSCHTESNTNTYRTFFGGIYTHVLPLAACSSCHNGLNARGMSVATHIPTNSAACDTCHKNAVTPTDFTSFSTKVTFVHGTTPGVCSTCHTGINGIRAKGMSAATPAHVPTAAACDTCHANAKVTYTSWLGASYIHPVPAGTCETCHNGNTTFSSKTPRGKSATHVPTTAACESCHTSTSLFTGVTYIHPTPAGVCSTCHNGAYAVVGALSMASASIAHVPTTAACDVCHTPATISGYTTFTGAVYVHPVPTGSCVSCHDDSTATTFGPTSSPLGKTQNHVSTSAACDLCHVQSVSTQSWLNPTYVHDTPAGVCRDCHTSGPGMVMPPTHVVTAAACDLCHTQTNTANYTSFLGATFTHTTPPGVCSDCHKPGGPGTDKSGAHITTTAACDSCHTQANTNNFTSFLGATYVHTTATAGICATCHNGTTGIGKAANHVVTIAECDVCHTQTNTANFTTFLGGSYSHPTTGLAACSTCHNGTIATGKPSFHIPYTPSNQECDVCHTLLNTNSYKTFFGAFYDHSTSTGVCATCHGGLTPTAKPKSANHVSTTISTCDTCHTPTNTANFTTFLGALYIHNSPAGTCTTCHNGTTARTKSATHVTTSVACDVCHKNDVTPKDFTSFSVKFQYVHATPAGTCSTCHNGTSSYGPSTAPQGKIDTMPGHVSTTAACDTCHANAKTTYLSWSNATYIHATPAGTCSTCHTGTAAYGTNSRPEGKSTTHVPTTAACDKCHTKTNTGNYATWFGATFVHISPVGSCSPACHSSTTAGNSFSSGALTPQGKLAGSYPHVTTTAQCSGCHTKTNTLNYMTFAGGNIYKHASTPGTCSTCHNGTSVFGASTAPMGKSANHVPTNQKCDLCHTKTLTSSYTVWNAAYVHETLPGVCTSCHGGTWTYSGTAPLSKASAVPTHAPTTEACDVCHTKTNTSNYTTFTGAIWAHNNPGGICNTCHIDGQLFPLAIGKQPGHFTTTAQCDTCHTQTNTLNYTTFLGAYFAHPSNVANTCSTCHNGAVALGKPSWHMLTTEQCDVCHTQLNTNNYMTFNGAVIDVDHTGILAGDCIRCHNGSGAKGVNNAPGHIPVAGIQCDGCHDKFNGTTVVSFGLKSMNHVLTSATRCDVCHNGSYTTQGPLGAMGKVAKHIPTTITGSLDCTTCHPITVSASVAAMTWTNERMNHNGAQGGGVPILCITCHLSGTTYQGTMDKKSHEGTSATKDCSKSGCHKPLGSKGVAYSAWD